MNLRLLWELGKIPSADSIELWEKIVHNNHTMVPMRAKPKSESTSELLTD